MATQIMKLLRFTCAIPSKGVKSYAIFTMLTLSFAWLGASKAAAQDAAERAKAKPAAEQATEARKPTAV